MWGKIFTPAVCRRELSILGACFLLQFAINIVLIVIYSAPWQEIFTSLGGVVIESVLIYGLIFLLRIAWHIIGYLKQK